MWGLVVDRFRWVAQRFHSSSPVFGIQIIRKFPRSATRSVGTMESSDSKFQILQWPELHSQLHFNTSQHIITRIIMHSVKQNKVITPNDDHAARSPLMLGSISSRRFGEICKMFDGITPLPSSRVLSYLFSVYIFHLSHPLDLNCKGSFSKSTV